MAKKDSKNEEVGREMFELSVDMCAELIGYQYEELTVEWLKVHTNIQQLTKLIEIVMNSVLKSMESISLEGDNGSAKKKAVKNG